MNFGEITLWNTLFEQQRVYPHCLAPGNSLLNQILLFHKQVHIRRNTSVFLGRVLFINCLDIF
jgi:hypothetical protein